MVHRQKYLSDSLNCCVGNLRSGGVSLFETCFVGRGVEDQLNAKRFVRLKVLKSLESKAKGQNNEDLILNCQNCHVQN